MCMARLGAIFIPVSFFGFGWTSYPSIHRIVLIMSSTFSGAGILHHQCKHLGLREE